jgi:hypothetical protein
MGKWIRLLWLGLLFWLSALTAVSGAVILYNHDEGESYGRILSERGAKVQGIPSSQLLHHLPEDDVQAVEAYDVQAAVLQGGSRASYQWYPQYTATVVLAVSDSCPVPVTGWQSLSSAPLSLAAVYGMELLAVNGVLCYTSLSRKVSHPARMILPLAVVVGYGIYVVGYALPGSPFQPSELVLVTIWTVLLWLELVTRGKFVPANEGYIDFFRHSSLAMQLYDHDGHLVYASSGTANLGLQHLPPEASAPEDDKEQSYRIPDHMTETGEDGGPAALENMIGNLPWNIIAGLQKGFRIRNEAGPGRRGESISCALQRLRQFLAVKG